MGGGGGGGGGFDDALLANSQEAGFSGLMKNKKSLGLAMFVSVHSNHDGQSLTLQASRVYPVFDEAGAVWY